MDEQWDALAMEIGRYLNSAVFSFDRASALAGEDHERAFVSIFQEYFQLLRNTAPTGDEIEISARKEIEFPLGFGKRSECRFSTAMFFDHLAEIAKAAYKSENDQVVIRIRSTIAITATINMDPIVISLDVDLT